MPFIEVFISEHKSVAERAHISDILHDQLVAHFNVPEQDKFHVFHQLTSGRRFFDLHYGVSEGKRSRDWMLIKILAGKPRQLEAKQALYQALAKNFEAHLGLAAADLMVFIHFNHISDWSFSAGQSASLPSSQEKE